jgi:hypothetical protein
MASNPADRRVRRAAGLPAGPPTVEEIVAVMRQAGTTPHAFHLRELIVVL